MAEKTIQPTGYTVPVAGRDRSSDSAFVQDLALTNIAGAPINPASEDKLEAVRALLAGVLGISAAALPLPAGAATDAKLEAVRLLLAGSLAVTGPLTDAQLAARGLASEAKLEAVRVLLAGTLGISAAALPLPAGAATDAKLEAVRLLLAGSLAVTGPLTDAQLAARALATEATVAALNTKTPALGLAAPAQSRPVSLPNDVVALSTVGQTTANLDLLTEAVSGWFDAAGFHSVAIQIIGSAGISAGQIIFEQTNDLTNAPNGVVWPVFESTTLNANPLTAAFAIAASTVRMFEAPVLARYVRVRISTAFVGGTIRAAAAFSQLPYNATRLNLQQATAASLNVTSTPTGTTTAQGVAAHAAAVTGNPEQVAFESRVTNRTKTTDAQVSRPVVDAIGRVVTVPFAPRERTITLRTALTTTTETTIVAAGAASVFRDLVGLVLENTGAAAAQVSIRDATAGTIRLTVTIPAGQTYALPFEKEIPQAVAANNWTATLTAVGTVNITSLAIEAL